MTCKSSPDERRPPQGGRFFYARKRVSWPPKTGRTAHSIEKNGWYVRLVLRVKRGQLAQTLVFQRPARGRNAQLRPDGRVPASADGRRAGDAGDDRRRRARAGRSARARGRDGPGPGQGEDGGKDGGKDGGEDGREDRGEDRQAGRAPPTRDAHHPRLDRDAVALRGDDVDLGPARARLPGRPCADERA